MGEHRVHFPLCRIRPQKRQSRALGYNDLLLLLPAEGTKDGLGDRRGLEHGQRVEEHVGIARHGEGGDAARRSMGIRGGDFVYIRLMLGIVTCETGVWKKLLLLGQKVGGYPAEYAAHHRSLALAQAGEREVVMLETNALSFYPERQLALLLPLIAVKNDRAWPAGFIAFLRRANPYYQLCHSRISCSLQAESLVPPAQLRDALVPLPTEYRHCFSSSPWHNCHTMSLGNSVVGERPRKGIKYM